MNSQEYEPPACQLKKHRFEFLYVLQISIFLMIAALKGNVQQKVGEGPKVNQIFINFFNYLL